MRLPISTLTEGNHRHTSHVSLTLLTHHVTTFFQPSARTVTTKLQLLLTFLLLCLSRLAKSCMSATYVSLETRQVFYKSRLQKQPCFFPDSTLHKRHVRVHFRLCGKSFLSLHPLPDLMITKAGRGTLLQPHLQVDRQTPHFPHQAANSLFCSQTYHWSLPHTL